jgi:hypothetical protein
MSKRFRELNAMRVKPTALRPAWTVLLGTCVVLLAAFITPAQQMVTETRDPNQVQDEEFAKLYKEWTGEPKYGSPLIDHLPLVKGIPTPKEVLGYYIGAPQKLTYYADILRFYRALEAATPRVKVETIGRSDEGRELVVVWVSSDDNMRNLQQNRDNLAKLGDPRGLSDDQIHQLIATTKPNYHLMGGLHSGETGPSEMLMELVYRIATETSPLITQIRNNVYVSVTPVADADGRDRNVDWFYRGLEAQQPEAAAPSGTGQPGAPAGDAGGGAGQGGGRGGGGIGSLPYWGKYVYHDNNRDINLSLMQIRALSDWYFTAHPPIMHDLHESMTLMYTYSGGPPQNPNLDPLLFWELPWFSDWELAQMTKWGMPGVYTHSFMDGWSPGYLGSIGYNHNGIMKMYETQSGRDAAAGTAARGGPRGDSAGGATGEARATGAGATGDARGGAVARGAASGAAGAGNARGAVAGRGGGGTAGTTAGDARGAGRSAGGGATGAQTSEARGGGANIAGDRGAPAAGGAPVFQGGGGRGGGEASGRGGTQEREWYRGLPVPPNATTAFSRRDNTNYMETGILSSLQLTAMFPNVIVENFYVKTRNSIEEGKTKAPYGFVIPVQRDMTRAAMLVNLLRIQGVEVGLATSEIKIGDSVYPAGSYVIKRDQPYGRLAKNLLEKQVYPDPRLTTYDDSGWTMGLEMLVDVKEIGDAAILKVATTPVTKAEPKGKVAGAGTAGLAVAHYGSNNMIAFRYKLRNVPMKIAEKSFTVEGVEFPAGSFVLSSPIGDDVRAAVESFGLTASALADMPTIPTHESPAPRIAIYSQWSSTQDLGWYRLTFDNFGIPYDLIFKEQVKQGNLHGKYDVILMAVQNINRQVVLQPAAARPQPYQRSDKYKFLGMYGETPDMSGGFGQEGIDAFAKFLEDGGTLIAAGGAIRFPIDLGWAHTVDTDQISGITAQRPVVQAEITRLDHPIFYGYTDKMLPIKYQGGPVLRVGLADQANILARYVGGDSSVLSGLMVGADLLRQRPFAVDVPHASNGKGRVILFANNPIYRWQNHGEFNMIFNAVLNWNYVPPAPPLTSTPGGGRGAGGGGEGR